MTSLFRRAVVALRSLHTLSDFTAQGVTSAIPLRTGRERLVCLGTGWGGARLMRDINCNKYDVTVISARNHMVFTPLLASTTVGTLEARAVCLPIVELQPALRQPQNYYFAANAVAVHPEQKLVEACSEDGVKFYVEYDVLAIATGSQGSTFGIPGVEENAHFLRDASHATAIRNQLIRNWNAANIPGRDLRERDRLLHTCFVGGGPTGVEACGELADFIARDLMKIDPSRARDMRITLVEGNELLGSFDARLRQYAANKLVKEGVHLVKGIVKEVRPRDVELTDGRILEAGLIVWSTGVGPTPFILSLPFSKTSRGRIAVDDRLRVMMPHGTACADAAGPSSMSDISMALQDEDLLEPSSSEGSPAGMVPLDNVFSLGDCCANLDDPLPALAQVAEQQGKYLAKVLNQRASSAVDATHSVPKFVYRSLGAMATVGGRSAIIELDRPQGRVSWAGFFSWLSWRGAYLTRLGTIKARLFVATNWTMTLLFGRDISRW